MIINVIYYRLMTIFGNHQTHHAMKPTYLFFVALFLTMLSACSGSDAYQGNWNAMDKNGNKLKIIFSPDKFEVKDSSGDIKSYSYSQNSYNAQNGIVTYGIQLEDGRGYQINFPKSGDEGIALIKDQNEVLLYTMGRKDYISYEDIYTLN